MAIQREDCYRLYCDGCGKSFHEGDPDCVYYPDKSCLAGAALSSDWKHIGRKWYCLDCWSKLDDDQ